MLILSIVTLLISIAIRFVAISLGEGDKGSDNEFHKYLIKKIKSNNNILTSYKEERVLGGDGRLVYPIFFHWLLSFFPLNFLEILDKYTTLAFDLVTALTFFIVIESCLVTSTPSIITLCAVFIIHPLFMFCVNSPRTYTFTPRSFSQFLFNMVSILIIYIYLNPDSSVNYIILLMIVILNAFNLFSSRFFAQLLLLVSLVSVLFGIYDILIITSLSFILAVFVFNKYFAENIKGHLQNLEWYYKKNKNFYNSKSEVIRINVKITSLFKKLLSVMAQILLNNQFLGGLIKNPIIVLFVFEGVFISAGADGDIMQVIIASSIIVFTITSFGIFKFVGEGQRYVEYTLVLQLFWFLSFSMSMLFILYFYSFLLSLIALVLVKKTFYKENTDDINEVIEILQKKNNERRLKVLPLDCHDLYYLLNRSCFLLVGTIFISLRSPRKEFIEKNLRNYPNIGFEEVGSLIKEYDVDYLIVRVTDNDFIQAKAIWKKIFQNKSYGLFEVSCVVN